MQRRVFLKHTAIIAGVAVVGLPDIKAAPLEVDEETGDSSRYLLYGNKAFGCAVPHDFRRHGEQLPYGVRTMLR